MQDPQTKKSIAQSRSLGNIETIAAIASIFSLIVAIGQWLLPNPLSFIDTKWVLYISLIASGIAGFTFILKLLRLPFGNRKEYHKVLAVYLLSVLYTGITSFALGSGYFNESVNRSGGVISIKPRSAPQEVIEILEKASKWQLIVSDNFKSNRYQWYENSWNDNGSSGSMLIEGRYRWDISAKNVPMNINAARFSRINDIGNFYVTTEVQKLRGENIKSSYGILFRFRSGDNSSPPLHYTFAINNSSSYAVFLESPNGREFLISWTPSSAIKIGDINKLAIITDGPKFAFFINDQYVDQLVHTTYSRGEVGLWADCTIGDNVVIEFTNFTLYMPS
jgi:hypothetical protein